MIDVDQDDHTEEGAALTRLILEIFRANGRLLRIGDAMSRDIGLTSARWQVLGAVRETPKTVAQIAREFELARQGVLWVVQALLKERMVELIDNPNHRRAKLVRLTRRGAAARRKMMSRQVQWINAIGVHFRRADVEKGIKVLRELTANLK